MKKRTKIKPRKMEFIAKLDGVIIGKRIGQITTAPFTHALIVQQREEVMRQHDLVCADECAYSDFKTLQKIANAKSGDPKNFFWYEGEGRDDKIGLLNRDEIAQAQKDVAAGWDAYLEHYRQREIARFERDKVHGRFEPRVAAWGWPKNFAGWESSCSHYSTIGHWKWGRIVPLESRVVKEGEGNGSADVVNVHAALRAIEQQLETIRREMNRE